MTWYGKPGTGRRRIAPPSSTPALGAVAARATVCSTASRNRTPSPARRRAYRAIAFSHAAIRAIQYDPEIRAFYRALARRKPPIVARAVVAKELARIVYYVLTKQEAFNGTFKGKPLSRTKSPKWPPNNLWARLPARP